MIEEIQTRIPEYARPADEIYIKVVKMAVEEAIDGFLDRIENPCASWDRRAVPHDRQGEAAEGFEEGRAYGPARSNAGATGCSTWS